MTWKEAWKRGAQSLQKAGVEEYDLDAWYLLEHVTGITKASYYMEPEHPMHDQEEREYLELIRRIHPEPVHISRSRISPICSFLHTSNAVSTSTSVSCLGISTCSLTRNSSPINS